MPRPLTIALCFALAVAASTARAQAPTPGAQTTAPSGELPGEATPPAPPPKPRSMSELLDLVRQGFKQEREENRAREQAFLRAKQDQERLLAEALAELDREEQVSQKLEDHYTHNDAAVASAEADLSERLGELGELFGVVRQVSTSLAGQTWDSLISSEVTDRQPLLERLGRSTELPSTQDMERLWFELQREMVEQGRVVRYDASVLTTDGEQQEMEVIRAGPFSAVANGRYLLWEPAQQKLRQLTRQPPSRYVDTIASFETAEPGVAVLALDPSRGSLLNALIDTPSRSERVQQGGVVGYVIIVLGAITLVLGVIRWIAVGITSRRVASQRRKDRADAKNPLGRVLQVYESNPDLDTEGLELKLDEVVLRESSKLEQFLWLVRVGSVVTPLLGLLGTVTGMIQTFQAITLYGAGDPKMMAGGISEALVTTMLGLMMAIPLVLLHAAVSNSTDRIISVLEEQSAGLVALRAEEESRARS